MNKINRIMTNICSDNLEQSRHFYIKLFDFNIDYDSDWFVHLVSKDKKLELGIIDRTNEIVPKEFQNNPQGFEIISEPTDTFYGQRRLLLKDPNGTLVDISSPIKNFEF